MEDKTVESVVANECQVLIVNITWSTKSKTNYSTKYNVSDLPDTFTMDLPENVLNQAKKKQNNFNDVVESFAYNFLTRKFGYEVAHCQIWLPLEDK